MGREAATKVARVKFAIWPWRLGRVGREPPMSVAAVAARQVDRLELIEVELGHRLQLLRQPRSFEIVREVGPPGAIFALQIDVRRYRRPPPGPWRNARRRRCRGCAAMVIMDWVSRAVLAWRLSTRSRRGSASGL